MEFQVIIKCLSKLSEIYLFELIYIHIFTDSKLIIHNRVHIEIPIQTIFNKANKSNSNCIHLIQSNYTIAVI